MNAIGIIFNIILVVLVLYLLLILIRVLASWFRFGGSFAVLELVTKLTDPYLKLFSKWRIAKAGNLNMAPAIGSLFLYVGIQVCAQIIAFEHITFGIVIGIFLIMIGTTISWVGLFFAVLGVVRFVGTFFRSPNPALARIWTALDHLISPMVYPLISRIIPNRVVSYQIILIIFVVFWIIIDLASSFIFEALAALAFRMPV